MPRIEISISTRVEEADWRALQMLALASGRSVSALLAEAIREDLRRPCVRPEVLAHPERSIGENFELGGRLAE